MSLTSWWLMKIGSAGVWLRRSVRASDDPFCGFDYFIDIV